MTSRIIWTSQLILTSWERDTDTSPRGLPNFRIWTRRAFQKRNPYKFPIKIKNSSCCCPGRGANPRPPAHPGDITSNESHALLIQIMQNVTHFIPCVFDLLTCLYDQLNCLHDLLTWLFHTRTWTYMMHANITGYHFRSVHPRWKYLGREDGLRHLHKASTHGSPPYHR